MEYLIHPSPTSTSGLTLKECQNSLFDMYVKTFRKLTTSKTSFRGTLTPTETAANLDAPAQRYSLDKGHLLNIDVFEFDKLSEGHTLALMSVLMLWGNVPESSKECSPYEPFNFVERLKPMPTEACPHQDQLARRG